jgi:diguanylate cyclase (GGDEF)-like protein
VARQPNERSKLVTPQGSDSGDPVDRGLVIAAGLAAVALLGVIDHVTGPEIGVSIIYLAPIGAVAWLAGRGPGLFMAVVAALTWGFIDRRSGTPVSHALIPVWNALVRFGFFTITAWLIADVRRMHAREHLLARSDALTGVSNARAFLESLEHELARMRRTAQPLTLAYVDLDRFKAVNDTLGHAGGDALLREVATRLTGSVRAVDVVARLGGDEFALLLPDTDSAAGGVALERCHEAMRAAIRETPGLPAGVGATIGAIAFQHAPPSAEAAIRAVDDRMYRAKRAGRDQLSLAGPDRPGTAPTP